MKSIYLGLGAHNGTRVNCATDPLACSGLVVAQTGYAGENADGDNDCTFTYGSAESTLKGIRFLWRCTY